MATLRVFNIQMDIDAHTCLYVTWSPIIYPEVKEELTVVP